MFYDGFDASLFDEDDDEYDFEEKFVIVAPPPPTTSFDPMGMLGFFGM